MRTAIIHAFCEVRDGYSSDVVIASPDFNHRFIEACRSRELSNPAVELNLALLGARKSKWLRDLGRSRRLAVRPQENYRFASEIAARFLERREQASLDRILCDPPLAREIDEIAQRISPGYSPFEYRWAALGLRKARRLKPEIGSRLVRAERCFQMKASAIDIEDLPSNGGVYLFYDGECTLYVGETNNLHKRLKKHLDHSDNKGLAHWIWEHGISDLHVVFHVLSADIRSRERKALEAELILSRSPVFNISCSQRP